MKINYLTGMLVFGEGLQDWVLILHPLRGAAIEQELDLDDCRSSYISCVKRRYVIIWFSPVQGLHTRLGCFKFARCSFFRIGCLEHLQEFLIITQLVVLLVHTYLYGRRSVVPEFIIRPYYLPYVPLFLEN